MQCTNERLSLVAPKLLDALQRLTHPAADDTDLAYAEAVVALAQGKAAPCECHGLEALCEDCGGTGCVLLTQSESGK